MAKKDVSKGITKVSPALAVPDFMEKDEQAGLETLKQYIVPPRVKVVQKSAAEELLKAFSPGDVILAPINASIVEMKRDTKGRPVEGERTAFKIVPIFFYPEWATWNPLELRGKAPAIKYRTVDPTDPIVSKSRNPNLRFEVTPDDPSGTLKMRHVEHLNYVVLLYGHPLGADEPAILTFARGEHFAGSKFASLIRMRKAPIFGCVFEAVVGHRSGNLGDWYGLDVCNPDDGVPWVSAEEYPIFKALHEDFAKYHEEARLQVRLEPEEVETDEAATPGQDEF
jgi:hypothetical protein